MNELNPKEQPETPAAFAGEAGSASFVLDRKGREIIPGDTIRAFHFIGRRRRKNYMYKFIEAIERRETWTEGLDALRVSHLSLKGETYLVLRQGQQEEEWEIVQGYGSNGTHFEDRPRRKPNDEAQRRAPETRAERKENQ